MRDCFAKFGRQSRMMRMNFLADGNAWTQHKGFFKARIGTGLRAARCKKRSYTDLVMRWWFILFQNFEINQLCVWVLGDNIAQKNAIMRHQCTADTHAIFQRRKI